MFFSDDKVRKGRQRFCEMDHRLAEAGLSKREKSAHQAMTLLGITRGRLSEPATLSWVEGSLRKVRESHSLRHRILQNHVLKKQAARRRPVSKLGLEMIKPLGVCFPYWLHTAQGRPHTPQRKSYTYEPFV